MVHRNEKNPWKILNKLLEARIFPLLKLLEARVWFRVRVSRSSGLVHSKTSNWEYENISFLPVINSNILHSLYFSHTENSEMKSFIKNRIWKTQQEWMIGWIRLNNTLSVFSHKTYFLKSRINIMITCVTLFQIIQQSHGAISWRRFYVIFSPLIIWCLNPNVYAGQQNEVH